MNQKAHLEALVATRTMTLASDLEAAQLADREECAFLANMSHEIRTPMNGILSMVHILRRDELTPRQAQHLDTIDTPAQHFEAESMAFQLVGDTTRLQQALLNYATNAVKLTEAGSTFWFTVRLKINQTRMDEVAPTATCNDAETRLRKLHEGKQVLVVDDEPINREIAKIQLESAGLIVDVAEDGAEAMAMAQDVTYAEIFMDMQMSNIDELEATQQIRRVPGYRKHRSSP
ncbi:MAG: response regulator [Sulfuritalea sp.]|nr:response regulator [Sulfuritalea sp.]